jgi:hypothetical protein
MDLFSEHDGQPPLCTGTGTLHLSDPTSLRWTMMVEDFPEIVASGLMTGGRKALFDERHSMRLEAMDYRGVQWSCGWVFPRIRPEVATHTRLQGSLVAISAACGGDLVAKHAGIELYFDPAPDLPLSEAMVTSTQIGDELVYQKFEGGREAFSVLGSKFEVMRDPMSDGLWLVAETSADLQHPYFEHWASEPLRILCGQLVYPRLIARNFGNGTAQVWLSKVNRLRSNVGGLRASFRPPDTGHFWNFYRQCLTFLARHRGVDGHPLFGANHLSRFHEEVIQAAGSSDWVLALAASSAIEGMCRLATHATALPTEFDATTIGEARKYLQGMPGPGKLRDRLISNLAYMGNPSVRKFLDELVKRQVIRTDHRDAWVSVRNRVAHGRLDGATALTDDGNHLVLLVELLNALTVHVVAEP